jgi:hypothetical protein
MELFVSVTAPVRLVDRRAGTRHGRVPIEWGDDLTLEELTLLLHSSRFCCFALVLAKLPLFLI